MKTEHMEYVLEIVRCRSISAAAKKLYMGQTTLSAIVNSVENELNIKIFQRTPRGVRLTADGEAAIAMMEEIANKSAMLHRYYSTRQQGRQTVHLSFYPTACYHLSLYLSKRYVGREDVVLSMHATSYNQIISKVAEGAARIGVGSQIGSANTSQAEASVHSLSFEKLHNDNFFLVVGKDSPMAEKTEVSITDVLGQHLAIAHHFPIVESPVGRIFRSFKKFTVFANNQIIKHAVAKNNMVAMLQGLELFDDPLLASGRIIPLRISDFSESLVQYLVYDSNRKPDTLEQSILDAIRTYYRELPAHTFEKLRAGLPAADL